MDTPLVLRLPRIPSQGNDANFVLVRVSSVGSRPLDIELIGTENESVFATSLKHNKTSALKAKNCPLNQEEWETVLSSILLGTPAEEGNEEVLRGIEAVAKVDGDLMTLTIQKRIEGITQRLGNIEIPSDETAEIDIFGWCGLAIESAKRSSQTLVELKTKVKEQEISLKKLHNNFEELVKAKTDHETDLLEKFSVLLNEKKLKIRDQQRLLSSANVDPSKVAALEASRIGRSREPSASRPRKRKAGDSKPESEESSDDQFEKMEVDEVPESEAEEEDAHTPEHSESEDDDVPSATLPVRSSMNETSRQRSATLSEVEDDRYAIPPKRVLPFEKKATPAPAPVPAADGSETESDDEL